MQSIVTQTPHPNSLSSTLSGGEAAISNGRGKNQLEKIQKK
jgi:hypothetical protein